MSIEILVDNIKCGGCANSISKKMLQQEGITAVNIDVERGAVSIEGDESQRDHYAKALQGLGYPEQGSVEGLGSVGAKAKSFVSCAVGRMSD